MPAHSSQLLPSTSLGRLILPVWLVTTVWDALCATALSVFGYGAPAATVWQGVALAALGSATPSSASARLIAGLAVHALVALAWSTLFVLAARTWPAVQRAIRTSGGALAVAAIYGPLIWLIMSLLVIPLATAHPPRPGMRWWIQFVAHVPFVSIPLVFTARWVLRRADLMLR